MSSVAHPGHSAGTAREERPLVRTALESSVTAVAAIWLCSALIAVLAPDMITGAQQEHLPIASLTVWVWTATATAYVLMATRGGSSSTLVGITAIWVGVLVAAVAVADGDRDRPRTDPAGRPGGTAGRSDHHGVPGPRARRPGHPAPPLSSAGRRGGRDEGRAVRRRSRCGRLHRSPGPRTARRRHTAGVPGPAARRPRGVPPPDPHRPRHHDPGAARVGVAVAGADGVAPRRLLHTAVGRPAAVPRAAQPRAPRSRPGARPPGG